MRVVIATFLDDAGADAYRRSLREVFHIPDRAVSVATAAAWGEPYHDHRLVVAWVPRGLEDRIRSRAKQYEARLHEPPSTAVPPRWLVGDQGAGGSHPASRGVDGDHGPHGASGGADPGADPGVPTGRGHGRPRTAQPLTRAAEFPDSGRIRRNSVR